MVEGRCGSADLLSLWLLRNRDGKQSQRGRREGPDIDPKVSSVTHAAHQKCARTIFRVHTKASQVDLAPLCLHTETALFVTDRAPRHGSSV